MRRILVLLALLGVFLGVAVPSVTAAPSDVRVSVAGQAQYVSQTTLLVPVTYVCPTSFGTGLAQVTVSQAATGAGGTGAVAAPCTGSAATVVIPVTAYTGTGTWTLGPAVATGYLGAGFQFDTQTRRIQIVL
jgi:hypothetical protein